VADHGGLRTLRLDVVRGGGEERVEAVLKALASTTRRRILALLADRLLNVTEIARALGLPVSTANLHVNALEDAGLLLAEHRPASRGLQKVCTRAYDSVVLELPGPERSQESGEVAEVSMPIGAFVDCAAVPSCGLAGELGIIGMLDDPAAFYDPDRVHAQLVWFHQGHLTYRFPNRLPPRAELLSLTVSCEVCSEAPLHHDDWPSDITLWVNGVEVGTWTSPADFGGQRGSLTPEWWESHNSQYGMLKVWRVTAEGSWIDGVPGTGATLAELDVAAARWIDVKIGVKEDATHVGGLNLFGRGFGNYPQDLVLRLRYRQPEPAGRKGTAVIGAATGKSVAVGREGGSSAGAARAPDGGAGSASTGPEARP
jgi:predicted transcriptional regulator